MIREYIDLKIKQVRVAMYNHTHNFKDFTDLVDYRLTYNEWKSLLNYIEELEEEIKRGSKANVILDDESSELQSRINKAIEYIEKLIKNKVLCDECNGDMCDLLEILRGASNE